ncbi:PREDICTED: uncharacterized protein LOC109168309 [Ipomoea nil]|uniref:uncharacterized protein LOC109168309 n=1 Tax=Ipomoea nil TaxID=35883 RepID=UPI000900C2BA|nr:PREDICTED: uncharacterized protein LOC109168309 [Ipomoea nil]
MAWTGGMNTNRSQGSHPKTTIPTVPIPATAPANTPFDPNDAASPFFLHPNENPSLILVSALLDGRNYHPWAMAMEMALLSKNKLGFVDGTIAIPDSNDVKFPYWKRCNNMVSTWIMRSLSSEIAQTVLWIGTAERIWKTLKSRFSEADIFRISDLHAEIHQIRQGDLSIGAYFAKLKVLWDELQVIRPLPICNCARRCDCGLLDKLQSHLDSDNLSIFLRGLNDSYTSAQSQIMMMKPLPSVDEAFLIVQQQERRFNSGIAGFLPQPADNLNAGNVFLSQTASNNSGSRKVYPNGSKKPICTDCGFTGHTADKCYKKHGYPSGWKPRNRSVGAANQIQVAAQIPSEDTISLSQNEYMMFKQLIQKEAATQSLPLTTETMPQANFISANSVPNAQFEGTSLPSSSHNKIPWILDSGATHHIVCSHHMLTRVKEVQGMCVELPNGNKTAITHIGTITVSEELVLKNVFCVPDFHYNLVSVSELIKNSNCKLLMYSDTCLIQDQVLGRTIGVAKLEKSLYHLLQPAFFGSFDKLQNVEINACNISSLWHARLGHTSFSKMKMLQLLDSDIKFNKESACDVSIWLNKKDFHSLLALLFLLIALTLFMLTFGGHTMYTQYMVTNTS